MSNSNLPTNVAPGTTGRIAQTNVVHGEVNELSRSTGLRDVTSLLANGWTATGVRIERVRDHVNFYWRGLNGTAATSNAILLFGASGIPAQFGPMDTFFQTELFTELDGSGAPYCFHILAANIQVPAGADRRNLGSRWRMTTWRAPSSAWPATLPGAAV